MDLSGIIFVALAIAWAVYLIPKALRHHDEVGRSRTVDSFSDRMRVLAHREPVDTKSARLVVKANGRPRTPVHGPVDGPVEALVGAEGGPATERADVPAPAADYGVRSPAQLVARRAAAQRALNRRRNVLGVILFLNVVVAALAAAGVFGWIWQLAPAGLLVVWLITCRVMVKGEIAAEAHVRQRPAGTDRSSAPVSTTETPAANDDGGPDGPGSRRRTPAELADDSDYSDYSADFAVDASDDEPAEKTARTATMSSAPAESAESGGRLWDPLPVTLPTYVTKATATRSVRTIELGEPGAWTSGRTERDSAIAREADVAAKADRAEREQRAADEARRDAI